MKIKKGDNVIVNAGKDLKKKGKVVRAIPSQEKVIVEGVNVRKRHSRPKKQGEKGQILEIPSPVHISNVSLFCEKCKKGVRVGFDIKREKKTRVCKSCGKSI